MAGLVLEGGTFRPIFSCGVMDALLDNGIELPYVIGVSAGITDAISYISKQKERNLLVLEKYRNDKRYIGINNFKTDKSLFGLEFAYGTVPNELMPFDMETYKKYTGKVRVGVTNCITGKAEYMDGMEMDDKYTMLRATCAIPGFFPTININGTPYYDGGIADPIPIRKSMADGNEKNLIILTQPLEYRKTLNAKTQFAANRVKKKYPELANALYTRHIRYNETVEYCHKLEDEGKAIILQPKVKLNSFEKDVKVLRQTNEMGYEMAMDKMDLIKELIKK